MKKALLLIDLQNDYFPGGKFPLWNTEVTLSHIEQAIKAAQVKGIPIIHRGSCRTSARARFQVSGFSVQERHPA